MARSMALTLASVAVFALTTASYAADLLPPAPRLEPLPPADNTGDFSGWYLRGDVGVGVNSPPSFTTTPDALATGVASGFLSASATEGYFNPALSQSGIGDVGVGYRFNNFFRADVTGELRGGATFSGLEVVDDPTHNYQFADHYQANVSSYIAMLNGYADLGTWLGVTPYVGGGVGLAYNKMFGATDVGDAYTPGPFPTGGYLDNGSSTNFAWALMAGLDFNVTPNLKLELGYRYLDYGSVKSGGSHCLSGTGAAFFNCQPYHLAVDKLASNDFRIGLIWTLENASPPPPEPLVRRY